MTDQKFNAECRREALRLAASIVIPMEPPVGHPPDREHWAHCPHPWCRDLGEQDAAQFQGTMIADLMKMVGGLTALAEKNLAIALAARIRALKSEKP